MRLLQSFRCEVHIVNDLITQLGCTELVDQYRLFPKLETVVLLDVVCKHWQVHKRFVDNHEFVELMSFWIN